MGVHLDPPEYDPLKSKIRLDPPKHAYGLSVGQMTALGLTGDQVQKRFQVEAVNAASLAKQNLEQRVLIGCSDSQSTFGWRKSQ